MIATVAPFIAGLGLFFCGVHLVGNHLTPLVGRRVRVSLTAILRHPALAVLTGILSGVVTQSSNAVTYFTVGLVSARVVDKRQAILVPTWSHVGTSVLVVLVAFDLRVAASYVIAIGGIALYFGLARTDRMGHAVRALLGIGLLFLGLQMLKSGADPVRDMMMGEDGGLVANAAQHPLLLLPLGAVIAIICQSSTVAGAITVTAVGMGIIDFSGACLIVYGSNLGSAFNNWLVVPAFEGDARQIALMQVFQKVAGFVVVLCVMLVELLLGKPLIEPAARALSGAVAGQVTWVFLAYQIAGSLFCTVFLSYLLKLLNWMAPATSLQELSRPAFLTNAALIEPSLALELAAKEERRLLERIPQMLDGIRADGDQKSESPPMLRAAGASIIKAIDEYLDAISASDLEREDRERAARLHHQSANLNALYEALDEFVTVAKKAREWPSSGRVADQMVESSHALLTALTEAAEADDPEEREMLLSLLGHRDELMERIRQRVMHEDPQMPEWAQSALFNATMLFERIIWLARREATLLKAGGPAVQTAGSVVPA